MGRDGEGEERRALLEVQQEQQLLEEKVKREFRGLNWTRIISLQE